MGIKVVKNSVREKEGSSKAELSRTSRIQARAGSSTRTRSTSGNDQRKPARRQEPSKAWIVWVVVGIVLVLTIVLISASMSGREGTGSRSVSSYGINASRGGKSVPYQPKRYAELGGKTMAEWEAENNKDNAALNARKRRRQVSTGQ